MIGVWLCHPFKHALHVILLYLMVWLTCPPMYGPLLPNLVSISIVPSRHVMSQPILELFTMDWFLHTCHVTTHFWDSLLWNDFYTCSLLFPFCLTVIHPNRSFVEVILILLSKCACIIIFKRKWVRFRSALLGIESNTFATDVASCYFLYNSDWYKRILRVTLILIQYLPV